MTLAVLQHEPQTGLGRFAEVLDRLGVDYEVVSTTDGPLPQPLRFDGVVALGGSLSATDSILLPARRWIRDAVLREIPYLGVCLGGQLLASALGAAVGRGRAEVGIHSVFLTEAAQRDPLFGSLPRRLDVFGFHGDSFDLPRGAVPLAGSVGCTFQAFRHGTAAYGLQFHPEVRGADLVRWREVAGYRELLAENGRQWDYVAAELEAASPELDALAGRLLERWLYLVTGVGALRTLASVGIAERLRRPRPDGPHASGGGRDEVLAPWPPR